ncbi:MAG TPA: Holliday junction resolvase RuvX [Bdellovibrionota bacterium]|nr:Holliday junction resolvase RuvX [Bdellovibrionota bacterium]
MPRIAAIDFGLKRIGIAVSDIQKKMAFPHATVEGGRNGAANTVASLKGKQSEIEKIVIGMPLLMNGKKGEMAEKVEQFGKELQEILHIPIEFYDERLSSKMAENELRGLSLNRKQRQEKSDVTAATLLLESYLAKN